MRGFALALAFGTLLAAPALAEPDVPAVQTSAQTGVKAVSPADGVVVPRVIAKTGAPQPKATGLRAAGPVARIADFGMPWQTGIYQ